jgi:threonine dehydratase
MSTTQKRVTREAKQIAHAHTQRDEGQWMGDVDLENYPVAQELVRRFNLVEDRRACPHLSKDWNQPRVWVEAVPELLACNACTSILAQEEARRANTCCLMCGEHVKLRSVSVATEGMILRGGICERCEPTFGQLPGSDDPPLQPLP